MKRLIVITAAVASLMTGTANAGPNNPYGYAGAYYGYPGGRPNITRVHNYYHGHSNDWIVPMVVGGAIGYMLNQPRNVVVQPQQQIYTGPGNATPVYQYQNIYDEACACTRRVLVQIN